MIVNTAITNKAGNGNNTSRCMKSPLYTPNIMVYKQLPIIANIYGSKTSFAPYVSILETSDIKLIKLLTVYDKDSTIVNDKKYKKHAI